ncbi:YpdA family putative bacillithiol disulfide reductase [Winogradskyella aurantiaca]|uniref:YpdA family putative bacillithiol disulfide reductase n=1 Tax=Winogradskyella aurantiaca TaxID=2219558 RepID=UPI000E1D9C91|nr:YpdA family putative bacillithiol disulfide reductase [Winogradskyella aurantiaca]
MKPYDVIIIGGGPIGIACGIEAQKKGLSYAIIEKGCIVNSLYNYPEGMSFFSTSEKLEIDGIPFISKNAKPFKSEALEYYRRIVTSRDLNMHLFEEVTKVTRLNPGFEVETSKEVYKADNLAVAIGFYDLPNMLGVPGEDLPKVSHYYNNPHFYARQEVAVVGASNSAVDAALEIYRKGGNVTMIVRGADIGERVKYWVRPDMMNRIKEGSIAAHFNTEITEIKEGSIVVQGPEGEQELPNDYVLALTGYQPNFSFLEKLGVELSNDTLRQPQYNEDTMESNQAGVYLAGVVCGGMKTNVWFIENSRVHAPMIMGNIAAKKLSV